jgi:hypothetical protein
MCISSKEWLKFFLQERRPFISPHGMDGLSVEDPTFVNSFSITQQNEAGTLPRPCFQPFLRKRRHPLAVVSGVFLQRLYCETASGFLRGIALQTPRVYWATNARVCIRRRMWPARNKKCPVVGQQPTGRKKK